LKTSKEIEINELQKSYEKELLLLKEKYNSSNNILSLSDNIASNMKELKMVVNQVRSNNENDDEDVENKRLEYLDKYEKNINERFKEVEEQRTQLNNLKTILDSQIDNNNKYFEQEQIRIKNKQKSIDNMKLKYEEIINIQKDELIKEKVKLNQYEDELISKLNKLKKDESDIDNNHILNMEKYNHVKKEYDDMMNNIRSTYENEKQLLYEENEKLKDEKDRFYAELLDHNNLISHINHEKEINNNNKNQLNIDKIEFEKEKENVTRIAFEMQKKSETINIKDQQITNIQEYLESLKLDIDKIKGKLESEKQIYDQKYTDLKIFNKSIDKMRSEISNDFIKIENNKHNNFESSKMRNGHNENTTKFIH